MLFLLVPLGLIFLSGASATEDFTYEGTHGPSQWPKEYQTCVGKYQSPINIDEHYVKNVTLPPLQFIGLENPRSSFLTNNGHTVMLRANESSAAMITGGPLNETYVFEQLHFHWGKNDREGSEDLINNHSFAMELHAVFYKKTYNSMSEATNYPDGLAVLAYFYETSNDTNPTYNPIVNVLPNAEEVGAKNALQEPLLLSSLLVPNPATIQDYYTYAGSLTTPPCLEVVTWIDFIEPQMLSHDQLDAFRNVQGVDGKKLTHNFRPIQPLDGRVIYHNINDGGDTELREEDSTNENKVATTDAPQEDHKIQKDEGKESGQERMKPSILLFTTLLGAVAFTMQQ